MSVLTEISENLQKGKAKIVKQLVQQAIDEGIPVKQILDEDLLSGMSVIGEKFKNNEVFVPEVLVAARAMNMGAALLKPLMAQDRRFSRSLYRRRTKPRLPSNLLLCLAYHNHGCDGRSSKGCRNRRHS